MRRFRACLVAHLEDWHDRNVVKANARQRARDLAQPFCEEACCLGHGAVTTKPPSSPLPISSDGGAVRSTPAPHPTLRPDEPKEIQ
jgi:hypothetical protein